MLAEDPEFWTKAREARDWLANQLLGHPQVSLIDIGYEPDDEESSQRIVLRVHLRQPVEMQSLGLQDEIDGIPVRLVVGDYQHSAAPIQFNGQ